MDLTSTLLQTHAFLYNDVKTQLSLNMDAAPFGDELSKHDY